LSPGARESIVIIDCGFQQAQLIARRVREKGVFSEVVPWSAGYEAFMAGDPSGLIIIGGPGTVLEEDSPTVPVELLDGKVPVLGICYGMPLIASLLGGEVTRGEPVGFGRVRILFEGAGGTLLEGFPAETEVWMSRWDRVLSPPPGFTVTARGESGTVAAFKAPAPGFRPWPSSRRRPSVRAVPISSPTSFSVSAGAGRPGTSGSGSIQPWKR